MNSTMLVRPQFVNSLWMSSGRSNAEWHESPGRVVGNWRQSPSERLSRDDASSVLQYSVTEADSLPLHFHCRLLACGSSFFGPTAVISVSKTTNTRYQVGLPGEDASLAVSKFAHTEDCTLKRKNRR